MYLKPNSAGFIIHWLVSGPAAHPYTPPKDLPMTWKDQLGYEKSLRGVFYTETQQCPDFPETVGAPSALGMPWSYYNHHQNSFVDFSRFYSLLTDVTFHAATLLYSDGPAEIPALLWTFGAVELWVNNRKLLAATDPVYKPILRRELILPLQAGKNEIYLRLQNLGVRDSRNLFGLQLKAPILGVALPGGEETAGFLSAEAWLQSLRCENGALQVKTAPPAAASVEGWGDALPVETPGALAIPDSATMIRVHCGGLSRQLELLEHVRPLDPAPSSADHRRRFYEGLAAAKWAPRGQGVHFSVYHVLARYAVGKNSPADEALLLGDLDFIESCGDCADFLVIGLIRLLNNYPVSEKLAARAKEVLLGFRYWMDEPGNDGMCFWSENHALMFYGAQLAVGALYPDEIFTRSGRTGREQSRIGLARCEDWMRDVEVHGADEFNSASYFPVTMAALLNLVDFAPAPLSDRVWALMDRLLEQLCLHVFDGSVISPQGRVYRDVIYPHGQSVQTVLHMIDPKLPPSNGENMWNVCFATSRYRFPENLTQGMAETVHCSYTSGNARIMLHKEQEYMLTSVCSPREGADAPQPPQTGEMDLNSYRSIRALNERFHGTNLFQPGVYGYQQHLWYAALSSRCVVFTTHPGGTVDMDGMRPGYWYGNGVFPALKQKDNALAAVYRLPCAHPVNFTHVFWPAAVFDECRQEDSWLFGRVGRGYIALWCSGTLLPRDDVLTDCEFRCTQPEMAYLCVCGSEEADGSFAAFRQNCRDRQPDYSPAQGEFTSKGLTLRFRKYENLTQSI